MGTRPFPCLAGKQNSGATWSTYFQAKLWGRNPRAAGFRSNTAEHPEASQLSGTAAQASLLHALRQQGYIEAVGAVHGRRQQQARLPHGQAAPGRTRQHLLSPRGGIDHGEAGVAFEKCFDLPAIFPEEAASRSRRRAFRPA